MSPIATVLDLRDKLIEDGLASVRKHEKDEKQRGGIAGFELCRTLCTPQDYQQTLEQRHRMEMHMWRERVDPKVYWEYHYATVQIEFVWERLRILWKIGDTVSGRAYMHLCQLLRPELLKPEEGS